MPHGGAAGLPGDRGFLCGKISVTSRSLRPSVTHSYSLSTAGFGLESVIRTLLRRCTVKPGGYGDKPWIFRTHHRKRISAPRHAPGSKPTPISCPPGDRSRYAGLSEEEGLAAVKEWQQKKYDAGWACITWPKEQGGCGATVMEGMIWDQEEAKLDVPGGYLNIGHRTCAPAIMAHSMEE